MKVEKTVKGTFNDLFDPYEISKCDFLLDSISKVSKKYNQNYTLLANCPNSEAVIKASVVSAKKNNAPLLFAATLNQVDSDSGYTGLDFSKFVEKVYFEIEKNDYRGPVIIGIDHGGPWLKDKQSIENWDLDRCMKAIKKSFEEALLAGYDLIHVDPTIDKTLLPGNTINIEIVVERTVELITYIENFRRAKDLPRISYEVGTEEVHGGLADMHTFRKFLKLLKTKLNDRKLEDVWSCFVVGKVGTDLHTQCFDSEVATELVSEAGNFGSYIKGHYTDYVENPSDYPKSGMGGANIGPELTEVEFEALIELAMIEKELFDKGKIEELSNIRIVLEKTVEDSGRWKKWLNEREKLLTFNELSAERRDWLVKTGARYIWTDPRVIDSRKILKLNLSMENIDSENVVIEKIVKRIDKYFRAFNLIGLNLKLVKELRSY